MRELLTELTSILDQGRECVYCALVETRGSTPQKAGAAMLVFPDGSQRGTQAARPFGSQSGIAKTGSDDFLPG
jgi:xanthine/CO dehydrogenase XdhC/CoxF family maturation factor